MLFNNYLLNFVVELILLTRRRVLLAFLEQSGSLGRQVKRALDLNVKHLRDGTHRVVRYEGVMQHRLEIHRL